jgi:leucyl-tRNA synthetase
VDETVRRFLAGKEIRKRILVPNRLINLVVQ